MSGENFSLKECLVEFLNEGISEMPRLETKIISLNPLKITDDGTHFFEISGLTDKVQKQISAARKHEAHKLILNDWNFVFKHVPNSHDIYIDIETENYRVESNTNPIFLGQEAKNMMDDIDIR